MCVNKYGWRLLAYVVVVFGAAFHLSACAETKNEPIPAPKNIELDIVQLKRSELSDARIRIVGLLTHSKKAGYYLTAENTPGSESLNVHLIFSEEPANESMQACLGVQTVVVGVLRNKEGVEIVVDYIKRNEDYENWKFEFCHEFTPQQSN